MSEYMVGNQLDVTVTVTNTSGTAVDPATFRFDLRSPNLTDYPASNYVYNGSSWTNSEATIGSPSKVSTGVYRLRVTVPHDNDAIGSWEVGWITTGSVTSGNYTFRALRKPSI